MGEQEEEARLGLSDRAAGVARRIAVLPASLANQIAAGEVVERPASAVKELLENAIDAGATRCTVEIAGGGITRLCVVDDGHGMRADDAKLALERHATSKLFTLSDLSTVQTYGFRGEALPSIASVSRFTLTTRTSDSEAAVRIETEGGRPPVSRAAGAPVGTTVEVRDLFFNVVARRKFLRSSGTESGHVREVVEAAAFANPGLTFKLSRDGRVAREWLRAADRFARVSDGLDEELAPCRGTRGPLQVEAFLSRPERARAGAGGLKIFVNNRAVKDRAIAHTVAQAYGSVLERGRYPRGAVYLDLPCELVDVNVHPQKSEVRFADARAVTDAVYRCLSTELAKAFSLPPPARSPWANRPPPMVAAPTAGPTYGIREPEPQPPWQGFDYRSAGRPRPEGAPASGFDTQQSGAVQVEPTHPVAAIASPSETPAPIAPGLDRRWASLRYIAQLRHTYLLCEADDGLYVIDQHAAAERVNFDRLRRQYRANDVTAQSLLFPLTLEVRPADVELIEQMQGEFASVGLELRARGSERVSVHTVPRLLSRASPEQLVRDLLTEVGRTGARAFTDAVDLALATMACHGSIRAGDRLSEEEATSLLKALDDVDFAGHCPHGRPVVTCTTWAELERKVGRR